MNTNIQLIALDLDGTTLDENKKITDHTMNILNCAIEKGIIIVPTTGRPFHGIPTEVLSIQGIEYVITANGASIFQLHPFTLLESDYISVDDSLSIIHIIESLGIDLFLDIFIEGKAYANKSQLDLLATYNLSLNIINYIQSSRTTFNDSILDFITTTNRPIEKLHLLFHSLDDKKAAYEKLSLLNNISLTTGMTYNLEINSPTVNKGDKLLQLANRLNIKRENIMACGDNNNDIEMIKMAGLSVAMENSVDEIKNIADYITKSNNNNGVAYAIEKFVL